MQFCQPNILQIAHRDWTDTFSSEDRSTSTSTSTTRNNEPMLSVSRIFRRYSRSNPSGYLTMRDCRIFDPKRELRRKPPFNKHRKTSHPYICTDFSRGIRESDGKIVLKLEYDWRVSAADAGELQRVLKKVLPGYFGAWRGPRPTTGQSWTCFAEDDAEGGRSRSRGKVLVDMVTGMLASRGRGGDDVSLSASGPAEDVEVRILQDPGSQAPSIVHEGSFKELFTEDGLRNLCQKIHSG
mmetsp:Transcript_13949/g.34456  ORF Transcript_13949/g.34456 Transcript_13949/m.34456 type:complete len:239 (-) Transcript_13949:83-799(-)